MTVRPLLILAWCAIALLVLAAALVAAMLVLTPNLEITNWRMMLNLSLIHISEPTRPY